MRSTMTNGEFEQPVDFICFFARHFVSIAVFDRTFDMVEEHGPDGLLIIVSGFLLSVGDTWLFVTAGHCFRSFELGFSNGRDYKDWRLNDTLGWQGTRMQPLEFDFITASKTYVCENRSDYGILILEPKYRDRLVEKGAVAISEESWKKDWPRNFQLYRILGIPRETIKPVGGQPLSYEGTLSFLPIKDVTFENRRIYGMVMLDDNECDGPIKSIDGMSGGPMIAFKQNEEGRWRYWIIGIQYGWNESSRIIYAFPLNELLHEITKGLAAVTDRRGLDRDRL